MTCLLFLVSYFYVVVESRLRSTPLVTRSAFEQTLLLSVAVGYEVQQIFVFGLAPKVTLVTFKLPQLFMLYGKVLFQFMRRIEMFIARPTSVLAQHIAFFISSVYIY